jgi:aminoglycoside 2''-phosphotransferase
MYTRLPTLEWHGAYAPEIRSVEPLGEGDFCVCYLVNQTHVLRVARHARASASLGREMRLLPRLEGYLHVQIPRIEATGTIIDTGQQFVFYPLVPGAALGPEALSLLEPRRRLDLIRQMAAFAARLHGFPVEAAIACGLEQTDPRRRLPEVIGRAADIISHRMEADVWGYHTRLLELYLDSPDLHDYSPALLHGDLSPWHFLADLKEGALTGVIDFGDSFVGDPHRDLVYLLEDYGDETLELFLTFYSPDRKEQASRRVRRMMSPAL